MYANESATLVITSTQNITALNIVFSIKDNGILKYNNNNITSGTEFSVSGQTITMTAGQSSGTKGKVFIKSVTIIY